MACVIAMITWASAFPAVDRLLAAGWDPLFVINARYALALAVLLPIWIALDGPRAALTARWGRGIWVGGIAFGFGAYLLIVAQSLTDPVLVAIVASCMPIAATILEVLLKERRLSLWFGIGLLATVTGGVVAAGGSPSVDIGLGVLAAVVASFTFAWGSHYTVRDFPEMSNIGRMTLTFTGAFVATLIAGAGTLLAGINIIPEVIWTTQNAAMLATYALFGIIISQFFWLKGVGRIGVALASFHINTAPFYVMIFMLALGAGWSWPQAIGAAIVAAGVLVAQRG